MVKMDTDVGAGAAPVKMGAASSSGIRPGLHGLVMMNVSEHIVRNHVNPPHLPVVGAILGIQSGRDVELVTSFELLVRDGAIDDEFFRAKTEQYKEVMPDCDVLGWYATSIGTQVTEAHVRLHKQMMKMNDNPLLLLVDPSMQTAGEGIPFQICESVVDTKSVCEDGDQPLVFCPVEYDIATAEAERVAIDHVATKIDNIGDDGSKAASHVMSQHRAVKMLMTRVTRILEYLHQVERGNITSDLSILRSVNALVGALSLSGSAELDSVSVCQNNEVLLASYIALMTRTCESIDEMTTHAEKIRLTKGTS